MKIKTSKLLAVLCTLAMMVATFVPMLTLSATAADTEIVFNLGANGSATHKDGSSNKTTYSETVGDYTLSLTGGTNMYPGSVDAKGNGCIKLGATSKAGGFSFTVPADVTSVVICIGKYKANTTKITVNGTSYTISGASNNGEYDEIEVDTSSTKTVTLTTVSGGYRAMVNSIKFIVSSGSTEPDVPACEHEHTDEGVVTNPTCTTAGYTTYTCSKCGEEYTDDEQPALNHKNQTTTTVEANCTENGSTTVTCDDCGITISTTTIPAAHKYVDGFCSVCGEEEPDVKEGTLTFDADKANRTQFSTSMQEWVQNGITFTNNKASSTNNVADYGAPVRLYASSSITIAAPGNITEIVFDCNNATYATALKNSIGDSATVNSDKVTVTLDGSSNSFAVAKLTAQVRIDSLTVTYEVSECKHENTTENTDEATCTQNGTKTVVCDDCGAEISSTTIPAGHKYVTEITKEATCTSDGVMTYTCQNEGCPEKTYTEAIRIAHNFVDKICTECGNSLSENATLNFDSTANRTSLDAKAQVWWGEGFTLTNDKAGSKTDVADYVNPVRFYAGSTITIDAIAGFNKLVFYCDSSDHAEAIASSIGEGATATQDKQYVTVVLDEATTVYVITLAEATRVRSITVYYEMPEPPVEPETPAGEITNASLELGTDLSFNFRVTLAEGENIANFTMSFTLGTNTVEGVTSTDDVFTINGIAPHQMGDTVTATLYKNGEAVHTIEYSIATYLNSVISGAQFTANDKALAEALLIYGAAAQKHQNYNTGALVTTDTPTVDEADKPESILKQYQESKNIDGVSFTSVGVNFDYVNRLYITLTAADKNVTVKVNGKDAEIVDGRVLTDAIAPADFDETYTFELYVDGVLYQTVEYSVNSYINAKWDTDLAKALYNYAAAVADYK